jgi:hypothetical protein
MDRQNVSKRDGCMQSDSRGYFAMACAATFQVAALRLTSYTAMRGRWKPHITVLSVN